MSAPSRTSSSELSHPVARGWLVHGFTGLGALCGMFGLMAVAAGHEKQAILWLMIAMILDGIDGPYARKWKVAETVPRIDGYTLDLIIDYVTCIVIPVLFMHRFHMLPHSWSIAVGSFVLFMSALWMSRTDQMTDDHWFNGFPCEWNMIVPTLFLIDSRKWFVAIACILLACTQLTNWKFVHPMQVQRFRRITAPVTVLWLVLVLVMTWQLPHHNDALRVLLLACPLYIVGLGVWRTLTASAPAAADVDADDVHHAGA